MTDATDSSAQNPSIHPSPAPEASDRCIRCQVDLGERHLARFCPRCGAQRLHPGANVSTTPTTAISDQGTVPLPNDWVLDSNNVLPAAPAPQLIPPGLSTASQAAAWLELSGAGRASQVVGLPTGTALGLQPGECRANDDDVHSLMLLGYANAMYRLGWRYETGLGSGHNPREALRCYFKAAKLGNIAALTRLAPRCMAASSPPAPEDLQGNGGSPAAPPPLGTAT